MIPSDRLRIALQRLRAVLTALNLTTWLVLLELVALIVSRAMELSWATVAALAAGAVALGVLSRWAAIRWEPAEQPKRALQMSLFVETVCLIGVVALIYALIRNQASDIVDGWLIDSIALGQFASSVMLLPFLARTTGRLGAMQLVPLIKAIIYWAQFVLLGALVCGVVSIFSEASFATMFGYAGPILACGFLLALRNLLVELLHRATPDLSHADEDVEPASGSDDSAD